MYLLFYCLKEIYFLSLQCLFSLFFVLQLLCYCSHFIKNVELFGGKPGNLQNELLNMQVMWFFVVCIFGLKKGVLYI